MINAGLVLLNIAYLDKVLNCVTGVPVLIQKLLLTMPEGWNEGVQVNKLTLSVKDTFLKVHVDPYIDAA